MTLGILVKKKKKKTFKLADSDCISDNGSDTFQSWRVIESDSVLSTPVMTSVLSSEQFLLFVLDQLRP